MRPREYTLQIDARMLRASGIGTYIRAIVPQLASRLPDWTVRAICQNKADRDWFLSAAPTVRTEVVECGYYDPRFWVSPVVRRAQASTTVWWAPHYIVPLRRMPRLITTVHDCAHLDTRFSFLGRTAARFLMRHAVRRSDAIICVSAFSRGRLIHHFPDAAPKSRVAPNGVSPEWFGKSHGAGPSGKYFVIVANNKPNKNLQFVCDAFTSDTELGAKVIIVGKRDGFIHGGRVEPMEGTRRIEFTGQVSFEELRELVANSLGLISASLYEGFSLPPLEAMASGVPIVVSDIPVHREYYQEHAVFFDPCNRASLTAALRRVRSMTDAQREVYARAARERARQFTWDAAAVALATEVVQPHAQNR